MKKGKLIVFEGISGTGKETQAKLLQTHLKQKGITAHIVFHPSPELKPIMKDWRKVRNADFQTMVYLLLADRHNKVSQQIEPVLRKGEWVISLRSYISALVYQGKTEKDRKWIEKEFLQFEPRPDFLFYFHIDPEMAMQRILKRHQTTGEALGSFEKKEILVEKQFNYDLVLKTKKHTVIDSGSTIESIQDEIIQVLG